MKTSKAFTLIELLVVVSIIFLLTSIFISNAQEARKKAADAKKQIEVREIQKAMFAFKEDKGKTPGKSYDNNLASGLYIESSDTYKSAMNNIKNSGYISEIPESNDGQSYFYYEGENDATIIATLESKNAANNLSSCGTSNNDFICTFDSEGNLSIYYKGEEVYDADIVDEEGNVNPPTDDREISYETVVLYPGCPPVLNRAYPWSPGEVFCWQNGATYFIGQPGIPSNLNDCPESVDVEDVYAFTNYCIYSGYTFVYL